MICIFILYLITLITSQTIDIPFTVQHHHSNHPLRALTTEQLTLVTGDYSNIIIPLCFSPSNTCLKLKLTTKIPEVWIVNNTEYVPGNTPSPQFKDLAQYYGIHDFARIGSLYQDTVTLGSNSLEQLTYVFFPNKGNSFQTQETVGELGLGFYYDNLAAGLRQPRQMSIIDQLHSKALISYRSFTLRYEDLYKNGGFLSIGRLKEDKPVKSRTHSCKLIQRTGSDNKLNSKFECLLDSAYFSDQPVLFPIKQKVIFNMGVNAIVSSHDFFNNVLMGNEFSQGIQEGKCKVVSMHKYKFIECQKNFFPANNMKDITFIMGKWSFKVNFDDLVLDSVIGGDVFLVAKDMVADQWEFGLPLLSRHSLTFDKEKGVIDFQRIKLDD